MNEQQSLDGFDVIKALNEPNAYVGIFRYKDEHITRDYYGTDLGGPDDYSYTFKQLVLVVNGEAQRVTDVGFTGWSPYHHKETMEALEYFGKNEFDADKCLTECNTIKDVNNKMDEIETSINGLEEAIRKYEEHRKDLEIDDPEIDEDEIE